MERTWLSSKGKLPLARQTTTSQTNPPSSYHQTFWKTTAKSHSAVTSSTCSASLSPSPYPGTSTSYPATQYPTARNRRSAHAFRRTSPPTTSADSKSPTFIATASTITSSHFSQPFGLTFVPPRTRFMKSSAPSAVPKCNFHIYIVELI
jgi:hypothetical protein